jgi:hypothetical protein
MALIAGDAGVIALVIIIRSSRRPRVLRQPFGAAKAIGDSD